MGIISSVRLTVIFHIMEAIVVMIVFSGSNVLSVNKEKYISDTAHEYDTNKEFCIFDCLRFIGGN